MSSVVIPNPLPPSEPPYNEPIGSDARQNLNYLQPNNYYMAFGHMPDFPLWCQEITLPGLNGPEPAVQHTPTRHIKHPGHGIAMQRLSVTFSVDEDLVQWAFLYNWINAIHLGTSIYDLSTYLVKDQTSDAGYQRHLRVPSDMGGTTDATLLLLTNKKNVNLKITFGRLFPISVGGIKLESTNTTADHRIATVDFEYNNIKFERVDPAYDPVLQDPKVKEWQEVQRRISTGQPVFPPYPV